MKLEKKRMPGNEWSFPEIFFLILCIPLPAPDLHIPMAMSSQFQVVIGLPTAGLTMVGTSL